MICSISVSHYEDEILSKTMFSNIHVHVHCPINLVNVWQVKTKLYTKYSIWEAGQE